MAKNGTLAKSQELQPSFQTTNVHPASTRVEQVRMEAWPPSSTRKMIGVL
jgi:hypothetical protein